MEKESPGSENKCIIFAQTKKNVDYVTEALNSQGWRSAAIHGDKAQGQRDFVINNFKNGKCSILVATDVAARGLGKT